MGAEHLGGETPHRGLQCRWVSVQHVWKKEWRPGWLEHSESGQEAWEGGIRGGWRPRSILTKDFLVL